MITTPYPNQNKEITQPIRPADDRKQYRAVGLLLGKYVPSTEAFTKGTLVTTDGTTIEAVILGKLLRLLKSRIDLEKEHLWVVYPRTREQEPRLHVQLCGIWEPATLHPDSTAPEIEQKPDYFSIQAEIILQNQQQGWVMVKIQQSPRQKEQKPKSFKLKLSGLLPGKAVNNFWSLQVQRKGSSLVIQSGERIAYLGKKPMKKRPLQKPRLCSNVIQEPDIAQAISLPKEPPKLKKKQPLCSSSAGQ
jgi:hypothetical protein